MGSLKTALKVLYLIFAAAVGVGCFYAFLFFIFNIGNSFLGEASKLAALGVAVLAIAGVIGFLLLGRLLYGSNDIIGPTIGIIIVTAILTLPALEVGSNVLDAYHKKRAKPYVEQYMEEIKTTFVKKNTTLEFDDIMSASETIRYWDTSGGDIWIKLRKRGGTELTVEELKKVMDTLPPAKHNVRIFIYHGSSEESVSGQYFIDFVIPRHPADPLYCNSDNYEMMPCSLIEELLVNLEREDD